MFNRMVEYDLNRVFRALCDPTRRAILDRLTLTHSRFVQNEARDEHVQGLAGCLEQLEALRAG